MTGIDVGGEAPVFSCQDCGACCAFSAEWPRFTMEEEAEIGLIPVELLSASGAGMRCEGDRCAALKGTVGESVACGIYAVRPLVCRDCEAGDEACLMARAHYGM